MIKSLPRKIDLCVLNGDIVDGAQRRSSGTGLLSTCMSEQVQMAIELLEPVLRKCERVIRLEGTAYHETFDGPLSALDEHFGIEMPRGIKRMVRDIQLGDAMLNIKHQPEGEGCLYRGTALDREALWATVSETMHKIPRATHIVRAHLHSYARICGFGKEVIHAPCWALQSPYAVNKRRYRWIPDIGYILMVADDKMGHAGYVTKVKTYPLPELEAETL
jgi:hypothetical protein